MLKIGLNGNVYFCPSQLVLHDFSTHIRNVAVKYHFATLLAERN